MRFAAIEMVTPPAGLPVTVQEFIDHARLNGITVDRQPDLIERELRAATERAERFLRRSIITQKLKALYVPQSAGCQCGHLIVLPRGKVQSVESVTSGGVVLPSGGYTLEGSTIVLGAPLYEAAWVVWLSGYGVSGEFVPYTVKEGILEYATVLYSDRSGERPAKWAATAGEGIPTGIRDLWRSEQIELSG